MVTAKIPLNKVYIENDILNKIPLWFFCLWYNHFCLSDRNRYNLDRGLNVRKNIPANLVVDIKEFE